MSYLVKMCIAIKNFITRLNDDNVGVYAAQASFFIILSIFPMLMLVLTVIGMTDIPQTLLMSFANDILPSAFIPFAEDLLNQLTESSSGTLVSISAIFAVWSASKGVLSIMRGLHSVYHMKDDRNYFIQRFISMLYIVIFLIIITFSLGVLVFGNRLYVFLKGAAPIVYDIVSLFINSRALISLLVLTLFFILIYRMIRENGYRFIDLFPGALFSACGWMLFSFVFSLYIDNITDFSYMYGSLTTVILFMLWLYAGMYIAFIGAEINVFIKEHMRAFKRVREYKKDLKKSRENH